MKYLTLLITLFCLVSCEKEFSQEPNLPPSLINEDGLVAKVVITSIPDNLDFLIYDFAYDEAFRVNMISTIYKRLVGGMMVTSTVKETFHRDELGRVTEIRTSPDTSAYYSRFHYVNPGSTQLQAACLLRKTGTEALAIDSTVYEYDGADQVVKTSQFHRQPDGIMKIHSYQSYHYDNQGNIIQKQLYQDENNSGLLTPSLKYLWQYDTGVNPRFQNEAALFYWANNWPTFGSPANITKQTNVYPSGLSDELTYVIMYNNKNKPVSELKNPGSSSITKYFYY